VKKTFNEAFGGHPLDGGGPSGVLQFMRNRRTPFGGWPEKLMTISAIAMAPMTGGASLLGPAAWHAGWGALSAPFEIGRGAVKTVRFLEKLGSGRPEYATPMVDTRQAYTMRQAALQTMHNSAYSIRSAIGGEARMLHS
jgi:hypothetical protein